jgi:hypothetical protein
LIFTAAGGWKMPLAYLIRYLGSSEFSHVGFLSAENDIYEATFTHGIRTISLSEFEKTNTPYVIAEVESADYDKCFFQAQKMNNLKYDTGMIYYHFLSSLPLLKWLVRKPISKNQAYVCSAHVATILDEGGVSIFKKAVLKLATPQDIYLDPCVKIICGNKKGLEIDSKFLNDIAFLSEVDKPPEDKLNFLGKSNEKK